MDQEQVLPPVMNKRAPKSRNMSAFRCEVYCYRGGYDEPLAQGATCVSKSGAGVAHDITCADGKLPEEQLGSSF